MMTIKTVLSAATLVIKPSQIYQPHCTLCVVLQHLMTELQLMILRAEKKIMNVNRHIPLSVSTNCATNCEIKDLSSDILYIYLSPAKAVCRNMGGLPLSCLLKTIYIVKVNKSYHCQLQP